MRIQLRHQPVGINMTPMIDVVFLLIVFFLVSSHLAQRENRIEVALPKAMSGQSATSEALQRLTLTLQADGKIWLSGRLITLADVEDRLRQYREAENEPLQLRVRCDRTVPYHQVEPVLGSAVAAGIWDISFAVIQRE